MQDIQSALNKIPEEMSKREVKKRELQSLFEKHREELVIYGHGNLGSELEKGLRNAGWPVCYFLDVNMPTDLDQKNINVKDSDQHLSQDALIIVALYDIFSELPSIRRNLQSKGFKNIITVLDLRVWPELFQAGHIHSTIGWNIETIPEALVLKAYSTLTDSISQKTFVELLHFMIDTPYENLTLCPPTEQYMPSDIYCSAKNEFIVDCGAYNGDTMRAFLSTLGAWSSYTAIDADPNNIEKVKESIERDIPVHLRGVTQAIHAAVSNEQGTVAFHAGNYTSSYVAANGEYNQQAISVPVVKLDDVIQDPVTLLKMDVEGFELRALQGAERLILTNRPLMTICGYHCREDLWEIPLYLKMLLPNHRIYLRNYVGIIEYVFYAVPEDRVLHG